MLNRIAGVVGRAVQQRKAVGVRPECVNQVKARLVETTASGGTPVIREVQHEIRIGVVDGAGTGRRLNGEN